MPWFELIQRLARESSSIWNTPLLKSPSLTVYLVNLPFSKRPRPASYVPIQRTPSASSYNARIVLLTRPALSVQACICPLYRLDNPPYPPTQRLPLRPSMIALTSSVARPSFLVTCVHRPLSSRTRPSPVPNHMTPYRS